MEELERKLLNKEVVLQEMQDIICSTTWAYEVDVIYGADVFEEEVLAYLLDDNTDMYIYVDIKFTHKNVAQPWLSRVIVKDIYVM